MTWEELDPQDQKEIINMWEFKKRYKKWLTDQQKNSIIDLTKERQGK